MDSDSLVIIPRAQIYAACLVLCIAIPWLNPFASGPSAAVVPWLVTLACAGVAALVLPKPWPGADWSLSLVWFFLCVALAFGLHMLWDEAVIEVVAALLAWALVAFTVGVGMCFPRAQPGVLGLAWCWLAVALLSCGYALLQYLSLAHTFAPWISASTDAMAYANLRQRNQFATLCGIGLLALLYLRQTSQQSRCGGLLPTIPASTAAAIGAGVQSTHMTLQRPNEHWQTAWPWLAVTVLAIGNGLSSSRTGALQWLLIAAAVLCWRTSLHRKVVQLALGAVAIYAVVVALMPWFASLVGNASTGLWGRASENAGSSSRLWLYSNVLELIAQKPWLGWGWRELAYAHYSTPFDQRFGELLDNAHNLPLHLAVELGVPFALLFCGSVLWWIVRSAPWRETDATRQLAWGVLMLIGVHSMVEYPLWYGPFLMTLGLCIGLLQPVNLVQEKSMRGTFMQATLPPDISIPNRPLAQWNIAGAAIKGVAVCLLVFAGYAAYDYHRVSQIYLDVASRSSLYSGDALGHAQRSVLFQRQARFAELVTTPVTPASAPRVLTLAIDLIHFSPEPRVIEALIESATMLHFDDVAMFHLARYKEVYPKDYAAWSALK
jgi:Virulence factor membrane-bound polymerase, C-terminal/O-Antigen ligase/Protein glycosylation ligase